MIQGAQNQQIIDQQQIVQCFTLLNSNNMSTEARRSINQRLFDFQKSPIQLMIRLLSIFENNANEGLKFQSLVYFCNVAKRNWAIRRYNKTHSDFGNLKKQVRQKLLQYVCLKVRRYLPTLFDVIRFIVEKDYPHSYAIFSSFVVKMINELDLSDISILIFKQLKEVFYELGERKGPIPEKQFEDNLREILNSLCTLTIKFKQEVISHANMNSLSSNMIKLSKYIDQIILYILRAAPIEILDQAFSQEVCKFLIMKLQDLISTHSTSNKNIKALLEKNIKSIIFDFGLLQISKPLFLSWILPDFFNILVYVFQNSASFIKNQTVRYSFIGLRRIIKQFTYYAEDNLYLSSIKSKKSSSNWLELRKICNQFYRETITENVIQQLLHYLLCNSFNKSLKSQSTFLDFEQGTSGIQRGKQKQISIQNCVILLIQSILQKFPHQTHILITSLLMNSIKSDWKNLDNITIGNLLSVIAILPSTCKKNEVGRLQQIPILEVLQFIYTNPSFKIKFAGIVSGWIDAFSNEQLNSITGVLLDFIQNQSGEDISQASLDLLMNCCQCLNKVVVQRTAAIDLRSLVQRVVPVALGIFQIIDNPQILWPMVALISNTIVKVEFDTNLIINSIDPEKLMLLIKNQSTLLVQALCQMFKNFLCVIPRNMQASSVYRLVCYFLSNHLSQFSSVNHEKIFHLWYIAIREYSVVQGCQDLYVDLFSTHFRNNMYRKTATLVFILEQYMLSSLIPDSIDNFIQLALQCYTEADDLEGDERQKLKIATLSFQITLISRYDLQKVNSNKLLNLIIMDLGNFDFQLITPTIRSSILSIINRYIIKHQSSFFDYLNSINLPIDGFFQAYFKSMDHLTSHTAIKINAIAVLQLMSSIDTSIIAPQFHYLLKIIIPSVQTYKGTIQNGMMTMFIGKIDNSPSLRFASNTLSERKQQVRKRDTFERIDLISTFRSCISGFLSKCNISPQDAAASFNDPSWATRFLQLL